MGLGIFFFTTQLLKRYMSVPAILRVRKGDKEKLSYFSKLLRDINFPPPLLSGIFFLVKPDFA